MKSVAVLMGGFSAERAVSLRSGEAVCQALRESGYITTPIDVGRDLAQRLTHLKPDVCFVALHGILGEDGTVQGLLEMLGIPYTGPGVLASALAMNKAMAKKILCYDRIPTPAFTEVLQDDLTSHNKTIIGDQIMSKVRLPVVVKPCNQGSTIGISFVDTIDFLFPAIENALKYSSAVLIEQKIEGTEVTCAILGSICPRALPLIEIFTPSGTYDYEAKYTVGQSQHIIPPRLPKSFQAVAQQVCLQAYQALNCRGLARVDCIIDRQGDPWVLEVNTAPGMTELSLFPDAARAAGMSFSELVSWLVENAQLDYPIAANSREL